MKLQLSKKWPYDWLVIAFLATETISTGFEFILSKIGLVRMTSICTSIVVYAPFFVATIINIKKAREERRFFVFLAALFALFMINLSIHPSYSEYYTRPVYGAYTAVFSMSRGAVWGLLVFTVAKKANNVQRDIHIAAVLLFVYCLYKFYKARKLGYWEEYDNLGLLNKQSYNLVFGYKCIFCCVVFSYFFLEHKNPLDMMGAALALFMDIKEGSRGSLICLVAFFVLYLFIKVSGMKLRYKFLISLLLIAAYLALTRYYAEISALALGIIKKLHIQSRTIDMLLSGNITSDNGRKEIAALSWGAIRKQGFFGMGPFGCRTVIAPYYNYGYPHNIALELILDFGWAVAITIMLWLAVRIIRSFIHANSEQSAVLIILVSMCMKLLISGSYWSEPFFWGLLGWTSVCISRTEKGKQSLDQLIMGNYTIDVRKRALHE